MVCQTIPNRLPERNAPIPKPGALETSPILTIGGNLEVAENAVCSPGLDDEHRSMCNPATHKLISICKNAAFSFRYNLSTCGHSTSTWPASGHEETQLDAQETRLHATNHAHFAFSGCLSFNYVVQLVGLRHRVVYQIR